MCKEISAYNFKNTPTQDANRSSHAKQDTPMRGGNNVGNFQMPNTSNDMMPNIMNLLQSLTQQMQGGQDNSTRGNNGVNNISHGGRGTIVNGGPGNDLIIINDRSNGNGNNGVRGNDGARGNNGMNGNNGVRGNAGACGNSGNNGWNNRSNSGMNTNNSSRGDYGSNNAIRGNYVNNGSNVNNSSPSTLDLISKLIDLLNNNTSNNNGARGNNGISGNTGSNGNNGWNDRGNNGNTGWNSNNAPRGNDGTNTISNGGRGIIINGGPGNDTIIINGRGNDGMNSPRGNDGANGNGNGNGWNNGGNRSPRGNDGMNGPRGDNGNNNGWNDRPQGNGNNNGWNDRPQGNGNNNGWNDRPQGNGNNNGWNDRPQGNGNNGGANGPQGNGNPVQPKPRPDLPTQPGTGKVWGDPHFVGANGQSYDIQGKAGTTYNVLSDLGVQVNSTFQQYGGGGATTMGTVGATLGDNQVQIDKTGAVTINGKAMEGSTQQLGDSSVTKAGNVVTLKTPEYEVTATSQEGGKYLDLAFKSDDVAADGVLPKGLWGVSANGAASVTPTEADAPKFAVKDLFDTSSYGVFTGDDAAPAVDTKIAAEGAATK